MGKCILSYDRIEILNQKSDTEHSDNDWLCMVWSINDQVYSKTIPLLNTADSQVLHSGDALRPFQDYVVCKNTDTIIVTYSVINLSSYDWGKQAEAAADFTKKVADAVGPIYVQVAAAVVGIVLTGGTATPAVVEAIVNRLSGGDAPILDKLADGVTSAINTTFDEVITPALKWVAEQFAELISGRPNCNGEVFHDYVIYLPNQPQNDLRLSKTYEGLQTNSSCGNAPHTKVDVTLRRQWDVETQADWRQCQKCNALFFDGYDAKGVCPGVLLNPHLGGHKLGSHEAGGLNFVVPHDSPGPGQPEWRFCSKCQAMFFNGYADKGVCSAGGSHEAIGYNFILMHDIPPVIIHGHPLPISGQSEWRYCWRCHVLFYDGSPNKGVCPAGGGHEAMGYNFDLKYQ